MHRFKEIIIIRGGGDIASAVAHKLFVSGFNVGILELPEPLCIRRTVAFSTAVFKKETEVESVKGKLINEPESFSIAVIEHQFIPVMVDTEGECLNKIKPDIFIDATLAKKNIKTTGKEAGLVIGLGPGFTAGKNCHAVIETNRGHYLGKVITEGTAQPDTGVPGNIGGYTAERMLRAQVPGILKVEKEIGESVDQGDVIGSIGDTPVKAPISGVIRGFLNSGIRVEKGLKIADIDPRNDKDYIYTMSDKARNIAGGVLEGVLRFGV